MERMGLGVHKMLNRLLVVCLGNICRSPALEVVLKTMIKKKGLEDRVWVESRGLSEKQVGKPFDAHIADELLIRGYDVSSGHASQVIQEEDFLTFDTILAVDKYVLQRLMEKKPEKSKALIDLVSRWSPLQEEIFDPYKQSEERIRECLDLIETQARYVMDAISGSLHETK